MSFKSRIGWAAEMSTFGDALKLYARPGQDQRIIEIYGSVADAATKAEEDGDCNPLIKQGNPVATLGDDTPAFGVQVISNLEDIKEKELLDIIATKLAQFHQFGEIEISQPLKAVIVLPSESCNQTQLSFAMLLRGKLESIIHTITLSPALHTGISRHLKQIQIRAPKTADYKYHMFIQVPTGKGEGQIDDTIKTTLDKISTELGFI